MSDKNSDFIDFSDTSAVNKAMGNSEDSVVVSERKKSSWLLGLVLALVFGIFLCMVLFFDNYSSSHYESIDRPFFEKMIDIQNNGLSKLKEEAGISSLNYDDFELSDDFLTLSVTDINQKIPYEYYSVNLNNCGGFSEDVQTNVYVYYFEDREVICFVDDYNKTHKVLQVLYGDPDYVYASEDFYLKSGAFYGLDYINIPIGDKQSFSYHDYVRVPREEVEDFLNFKDWKGNFLRSEEFYNLADDYFSGFESACIEGDDDISLNLYNIRQDRTNFKRAMESYKNSDEKSGVNPAESYVKLLDYIVSNFDEIIDIENMVPNSDGLENFPSVITPKKVDVNAMEQERFDEFEAKVSEIKKGIEKAKNSGYAISDVLLLYDSVVSFLEDGGTSIYYVNGESNMHNNITMNIKLDYEYDIIFYGNYDYEIGTATYNDYLLELVPELTAEGLLAFEDVGNPDKYR